MLAARRMSVSVGCVAYPAYTAATSAADPPFLSISAAAFASASRWLGVAAGRCIGCAAAALYTHTQYRYMCGEVGLSTWSVGPDRTKYSACCIINASHVVCCVP